jgi:hypothetical protein
MNYYAVLTDHGAQLIEQAYQHGQVVAITQMAIGDGGGVELEPAPSALAVAGEFDRVPLTSGASASSMLGGGVDYEGQAHVGKWIRTLGLMDAQGNLIVYANYPPTYIADKGSTLFRTLGLNIQLPIVHGDAVTVIVERPPYSWDEIENKPGNFPPAQHSHGISEVTGLEFALNNKAPISHDHTPAEANSNLLTGSTYGVIGSYMLLQKVGNLASNSPGQTFAGSALKPASASGAKDGDSFVGGSWKLMGVIGGFATQGNPEFTSLFIRVA